jgi:hypothetical protein
MWDAATSKVHAPKPAAEPLPSDARFRQDLRALKVMRGPAAACNGPHKTHCSVLLAAAPGAVS